MNRLNKAFLFIAVSLTLTACDSLPSWMGGKTTEKPKLAGERISVLPVASGLEPDAALKNTPMKLPPATPNDNWPEHGGDFKSDVSNLAAGGNFDTINHATIGRGEEFENTLIATPVVGGSLVYAMDQLGNISAHEAAHIENVHWEYGGLVEDAEPDVVGGGFAYDQGKLYVASGRGTVVALDAQTGKEIWKKMLHLPFRSAPKIAEGKLFAITLDNQTYALNITDGSVAWTHRGISESAGLMNSVSPTIDGDFVVVPYSSGEVYVLSASDGKEIWSESLGVAKRSVAALFSGIGGDPIVDGGVVFSVSNGGTINVQALSTGQHVWDRPIGAMNTPWMAGDNLFILTTDNTLLSLVKFDGHIRWATKLQTYANVEDKKDPITWKGPVMVDGKLAVVGSNGQLLLVSAEDGKILTTQEIPEDIYTAPVIAGGRMYLIGLDATLYSLK